MAEGRPAQIEAVCTVLRPPATNWPAAIAPTASHQFMRLICVASKLPRELKEQGSSVPESVEVMKLVSSSRDAWFDIPWKSKFSRPGPVPLYSGLLPVPPETSASV